MNKTHFIVRELRRAILIDAEPCCPKVYRQRIAKAKCPNAVQTASSSSSSVRRNFNEEEDDDKKKNTHEPAHIDIDTIHISVYVYGLTIWFIMYLSFLSFVQHIFFFCVLLLVVFFPSISLLAFRVCFTAYSLKLIRRVKRMLAGGHWKVAASPHQISSHPTFALILFRTIRIVFVRSYEPCAVSNIFTLYSRIGWGSFLVHLRGLLLVF